LPLIDYYYKILHCTHTLNTEYGKQPNLEVRLSSIEIEIEIEID
jgi:hypothetical protein